MGRYITKVVQLKPEIKSYDCVDYDPIESHEFDDNFDVTFWMNFTIGLSNSVGGDNFLVRIATYNNIELTESIDHTILLDEYSFPQVLSEVDDLLSKCQGNNWEEISSKLSKYMHWEFQDYQP
ncbi:hypothetical protein SOPP22_16735 [Shewanella sp. OPT22]|nr:hypothetical protein SOPP22_16735 [Shewanella sp. OPT22]